MNHVYDIGLHVNKNIDDDLKEKLLRQTWTPSSTYDFQPQLLKNGKKRFFQLSWFQRYTWLAFSALYEGAFCKVCVLFNIKEGCGKGIHMQKKSLVSEAFKNWKDGLEYFNTHESNTYHKEAFVKSQNFLATRDDIEKSIDFIINKNSNEIMKDQMYKIRVIIETILLCGRQEIALRGNNDSGGLSFNVHENEGNFRALLKYRSQGDHTLMKSISESSKNATYFSPQIQNEIIDIIGEYIQEQIIKDVRESRFFSLLADETTDISGKEKLSLCIRFYDKKAHKIMECFLKYVQIENLTSQHISEVIISEIAKLGLDLQMLRGQGYDGAPNMSGHQNGVQTKIKDIYPSAIYIHCASHVLNLCLNSASKIAEIRSMFGALAEICSYFRRSAKKSLILSNVFKANGKTSKRLSSYCETRWVERHDCVELFFESMPEIVEALEEIGATGKDIL